MSIRNPVKQQKRDKTAARSGEAAEASGGIIAIEISENRRASLPINRTCNRVGVGRSE